MLCDECQQEKPDVEDYLYVDENDCLDEINLCDSCAPKYGFNPAAWRAAVAELEADFRINHND